jgi:O-antigen ligase
VLFWGVLVAENRYLRQRRTIALVIAAYLLYSSVSRAGILACLVAVGVMCVALRRKKLIIVFASVILILGSVMVIAQPEQFDAFVTSFSENVVYKGKPEEGILASRKSPWQDTLAVIKQNPWFGTGFGTDVTPGQIADSNTVFRSNSEATKEHGSSYLALLEYVGLLGVVPFVVLLSLVLHLIFRSCSWMWRTGSPQHYAIPLCLICLAGIVHAGFEDWLFAVGYYLNIFFWTSVFILADTRPGPVPKATPHNAWERRPAISPPIAVPAGR